VKIVSLNDIRAKDYSLSISGYIEKAAKETVSPAEVREKFFTALKAARTAEETFKKLLVERGYVHE
jgi:type I restriction enzyme M protein